MSEQRLRVIDALRLAMEHHRAGKLDSAEQIYRAVLQAEPRNDDALHLLGIVQQQRGRHEEAVALFRQAIALASDYPEFWHNLGNSLLHLRRSSEAADAFATAAKLRPDFFEAQHNRGLALSLLGRSNQAADALRAAIALNPDSPEAHNNYGMTLKDQGEVAAAIAQFESAIALRPDYTDAHDNRLYAMHFDPSRDAEQIYQAHVEWARRFADPLDPGTRQVIDRARDRRLRIGFVSPDLRDHPIGRSMLPLLEHCDRGAFDVVCYSDTPGEDAVTKRLRAGATTWRDTRRLNDVQLVERIRGDAIDILVDLGLHMHRNRLLVFARRAAPVQATFIGYPATTGLRQIDWRITDRYLDPPGETESINSERLIRLPSSFWCYAPDDDAPPLNERDQQRITFGSLNNPAKMNDRVIDLWSEVLRNVPHSRLMMYVIERDNVGDRFARLFAERGIDRQRLSFVSRLVRGDYLRQYQQIDIGLDPFPYAGHMTSCDALFMGVPVVSLRGSTSVARGGESLLANLGLTELLARSQAQYVQIATALANDRAGLAELRRTLRPRMAASPLMDQAAFARDVYSCLRAIWLTLQA